MDRPISNWPQSEIDDPIVFKTFQFLSGQVETNAFGIKL